MSRMSRQTGRKQRTRSGPQTVLSVRVASHSLARINDVAAAAGIAQIMYVEALLSRDVVDENGRPLWAPELGTDADALFSMDVAPVQAADRVKLTGLVSPDLYEKASAAALATWPPHVGRPRIGAYLDELVVRDTLDHRGVPTWLSAHLTSQEELPLAPTG